MTQPSQFMKVRKSQIRYSQAFMRAVVDDLEKSGLGYNEARRKYGIKGIGTIERWVQRMGNLESLPKVIRVETPNERDRVKDLEKQIRELKEALADTQVRYLIAETQLEVVCEQQGLNIEEVKKKLKSEQSKKESKKD